MIMFPVIEATGNIASWKVFKVTLMEILKSLNMFLFISKQYPENFAFLILRIVELFPREVCKFLKK